MIIDSHCHLDQEPLYHQLDDVVNRATKNNVKYILTISTNFNSFDKIKSIVNKYSNVYGTIGIHPHESKDFTDLTFQDLVEKRNNNKKIIGIGESGLDFYYNHSDKNCQKENFIEHIKASSNLNIPIIVHTRNAEIETFDILKSEVRNSNLKILIHCFTGSKNFAHKLLDLGCYISFSGIITFKKNNDLQNVAKSIPIDRLLIETDAPYLAPEPMRGKKNEPSFIKYTFEKMSLLKDIEYKNLSNQINKNFFNLFNF